LFDSKYRYFMVLGPSCTVLGLIIDEVLTRQLKLKVFAKHVLKIRPVPAENPVGGLGVLTSVDLGLGNVLTKLTGPVALWQSLEERDMLSFVFSETRTRACR
jgi:hypothetical protein